MRRVVVTGMGAITPVGCDIDTIWNNLKNGVSGICKIERFDPVNLKVSVDAEVKDFDPLKYMDKPTARKTDLFVRYALAAAKQAIDESGIIGTVEDKRIGVYFGSGVGGFETFIQEYDALLEKGAKRVSPLFIPKMISNIAAGNIAIQYQAKGPCLSFTTACATGTSAVGEAYRAVAGGFADAIIAGGSDAAISELALAGFSNCMALTECDDPTEASIPFDARRSGFVMGEGAGCLILEEYEHAKARGAKILAEVAGYGSTCDAHHVTAPDETATASGQAIVDCMETVSVPYTPEQIYINAHGTSTHLNDKTETQAIKNALGDDAYKVHVSSTKSMTGHLLGAAGAVEAIVAIKALNDGVVPPTIGYKEKDPDCDLDITPNKAVKAQIELAMSTSLGFGGHNACIGFTKV